MNGMRTPGFTDRSGGEDGGVQDAVDDVVDDVVDDAVEGSLETDEVLLNTSEGEITRLYLKRFIYSPLGLFILWRMRKNRDVKIMVTSRGHTTGTGKTTLAILLARIIQRLNAELFTEQGGEWSADDGAFVDAWEYISAYRGADPGDVLLADEVEIMMDSRRSMTERQTKLSQELQRLRNRNVVSIYTAPGWSATDKRMRDTVDVWINVQNQGTAYPYFLTINDFSGERVVKRFKWFSRKTQLMWTPVDGDDDKKAIDAMKDEIPDANENRAEDAVESINKQMKRAYAANLLAVNDVHEMGLTQADIARMVPSEKDDKEHMSQQWVSRVKSDYAGEVETIKQRIREGDVDRFGEVLDAFRD